MPGTCLDASWLTAVGELMLAIIISKRLQRHRQRGERDDPVQPPLRDDQVLEDQRAGANVGIEIIEPITPVTTEHPR